MAETDLNIGAITLPEAVTVRPYPLPEEIVIGNEPGTGKYTLYRFDHTPPWKPNVYQQRVVPHAHKWYDKNGALYVENRLSREILIVQGLCPCETCDHETSQECYEAQCVCCADQCC